MPVVESTAELNALLKCWDNTYDRRRVPNRTHIAGQLIGDSGTGKRHLLIGLGTAGAEAGHRVRYTLASNS